MRKIIFSVQARRSRRITWKNMLLGIFSFGISDVRDGLEDIKPFFFEVQEDGQTVICQYNGKHRQVIDCVSLSVEELRELVMSNRAFIHKVYKYDFFAYTMKEEND